MKEMKFKNNHILTKKEIYNTLQLQSIMTKI